MAEFRGFDPDGPVYEIPNKFYDVLLSTFKGLSETKLALLFTLWPAGLHTVARLSKRSGQSKVSICSCLHRWAERGLVRQVSLAPTLSLIAEAGKCAGCSAEYPFMEGHHIVPQAEGGSDDPSNVVDLCPNCHRLMHWALWELTPTGRAWLGLEKQDGPRL